MQHPTPRKIHNAINEALHEDMEKHSFDGPDAPMPARAFRLVREAISKACDEAEKGDRKSPANPQEGRHANAPQKMDRTYSAVQSFLYKHVIRQMAESGGSFGPLETCWGLSNFTNDWITRDMARALLRDLTNRGFCYFQRGLFTEDGEVAGAGYGLTRKGLDYYHELCPAAQSS